MEPTPSNDLCQHPVCPSAGTVPRVHSVLATVWALVTSAGEALPPWAAIEHVGAASQCFVNTV